ncbi:MAG: OmpA family protein [Flavobacteriales bacterium]|nr:OmpA family protein [Flavobacteriales bacterium]
MSDHPSIALREFGWVFLFLILSSQGLQSQNLAPNASFEDHSYCPVNFNQGQLEIVKDWNQASRGTSDYFHACSRLVGVPRNSFGYQEAKDGNAYLGLITFAPSKKNYREYMQARLEQPMSPDQEYCVSFYVSSADRAEFVTDALGAVFSQNKVKNPGQKVIAMSPQLSNPEGNILDNAESWILLSDIYKAQGGERYVTLGNFSPDHETHVKKRNVKEHPDKRKWESAYYYVDQLSIVPVDGRKDCSCSIPIIAAEIRDSLRWKLPPGEKVSFDNVLFGFDNDELDGDSKEMLNEVAGWMRNNDFLRLQVMGHTDIIGAADYNLDLSERRAHRVLEYLTDLGVPNSRLSIEYYGASRPVADNRSSTGRSQNRRVDFTITEERYLDYRSD